MINGIRYRVKGVREKILEFGLNVLLRSVFFEMTEFLDPVSSIQYPGSSLFLSLISNFKFPVTNI